MRDLSPLLALENKMTTIILAVIGTAIILATAFAVAIHRALRAGMPSKMFERYRHHGENPVWVRADLRGRHRDHCLCCDCKRFHPGESGNCPVAQAVYQNCLNYQLVTPIWECPRFTQDPFKGEPCER